MELRLGRSNRVGVCDLVRKIAGRGWGAIRIAGLDAGGLSGRIGLVGVAEAVERGRRGVDD